MFTSYPLPHEGCARRHEIQRRTQTLGNGTRILQAVRHGFQSYHRGLRAWANPRNSSSDGDACDYPGGHKGANLKADILDTLSGTVRDGAKEALVGSNFFVIARESMRFLARGQGKKCRLRGQSSELLPVLDSNCRLQVRVAAAAHQRIV